MSCMHTSNTAPWGKCKINLAVVTVNMVPTAVIMQRAVNELPPSFLIGKKTTYAGVISRLTPLLSLNCYALLIGVYPHVCFPHEL